MNLIIKLAKGLSYRLARNSWTKAAIEADPNYIFGPRAFLKELNLFINKGQHQFLLDSYGISKELANQMPSKFYFEGDDIIIEINKVRHLVSTAEEIYILNEIYTKSEYKIRSKGNRINVIDIGMNVGFSALFFANMSNVNFVFGYELFKPTFIQCLRNLDLNPLLTKKIRPCNFGLSNQKRNAKLKYSYEFKGQMGIHELSGVKTKVVDTSEINVTFQDAAEEVSLLFEKEEVKSQWVMKIDTEGSELDILNRLKSTDLLKCFDEIILEYHNNENEEIAGLLRRENFTVDYTCNNYKETGILRAINNKWISL